MDTALDLKTQPCSRPSRKPNDTQPEKSLLPATTAMTSGLDALRRSTRLRTMWPRLERLCSPRSERLWFIGGAPGNYKTPLIWNLALDLAERKHRVLVVTLELTAGQLGVLALSRYSRIPVGVLEKAQTGETHLSDAQEAGLEAASLKLAASEMYLRLHDAEEHGWSIEDVIRSATRSRFNAVFIDHLGMIGRDQGNELEQLSRNIDRLRALKSGQVLKGYHPFVCATSPLNREGRKDEDEKLPAIGDFRGSSRIDYDADLALILRKQKRDAADESDTPDVVDAFVVKNRWGRCPLVLQFEGQGAIGSITERHKQDAPPTRHWQDSEEA